MRWGFSTLGPQPPIDQWGRLPWACVCDWEISSKARDFCGGSFLFSVFPFLCFIFFPLLRFYFFFSFFMFRDQLTQEENGELIQDRDQGQKSQTRVRKSTQRGLKHNNMLTSTLIEVT